VPFLREMGEDCVSLLVTKLKPMQGARCPSQLFFVARIQAALSCWLRVTFGALPLTVAAQPY
jgi:hypothetical protein